MVKNQSYQPAFTPTLQLLDRWHEQTRADGLVTDQRECDDCEKPPNAHGTSLTSIATTAGLRLPSEAKDGANAHWIPGAGTPGGDEEAVMIPDIERLLHRNPDWKYRTMNPLVINQDKKFKIAQKNGNFYIIAMSDGVFEQEITIILDPDEVKPLLLDSKKQERLADLIVKNPSVLKSGGFVRPYR